MTPTAAKVAVSDNTLMDLKSIHSSKVAISLTSRLFAICWHCLGKVGDKRDERL
jgi:hypothetical protein